MSDNERRDWLKEYLKKHLGQWMREIDKQMMKPPFSKNWPQQITVKLPCECCGKIVEVPFIIKHFRAMGDINWPYHFEYVSPSLNASTCPLCKMPFRMNRPVPQRVQ